MRGAALLGVMVCGWSTSRRLSRRERRTVDTRVHHIAAAPGPAPGGAEAVDWQTSSSTMAVLAHELRAPVNAVLGWTKLLQTGRLSTSSAARALAAIERCTASQGRLVADMFDLSRILLGTYRPRIEPTEFTAVVRAAMDEAEPLADARGIAIAFEHDGEEWIVGEASRLEQAVSNLLCNAIKHTRAGGRVSISLKADARAVTLGVRDDGDGIPPELLPLVFEPFARSQDDNPAHDGAGLGLALVRQIVEMHGGRVAAASDGRGRGSTFTLTLPRQRAAVAAVTAEGRSFRPLEPAEPARAPRGPSAHEPSTGYGTESSVNVWANSTRMPPTTAKPPTTVT